MKTLRHGSGGEALAVAKGAFRRGFSLVELMVVIGIIAVLALIAVPVGSKMVEKGRAAKCLAKMRSLGAVMSHYRLERNQRMWRFKSVENGGEGEIAPVRIFFRYGLVHHATEMCCPEATTAEKGAWLTNGDGTKEYKENIATQYVSYSVNGVAFYANTPYYMSTSPLTNYLQFEGNESRTPLFMDGTFFQLNENSWKKNDRFNRLALRHNNRCHVLFMDGHIEALDRRGVELVDPFGGYNKFWLRDFGFQ